MKPLLIIHLFLAVMFTGFLDSAFAAKKKCPKGLDAIVESKTEYRIQMDEAQVRDSQRSSARQEEPSNPRNTDSGDSFRDHSEPDTEEFYR